MEGSIPHIQSVINFIIYVILICYFHLQVGLRTLCHAFKQALCQ
jgi:hypothetical protein